MHTIAIFEDKPSDIDTTIVKATCTACGRRLLALRENCWKEGEGESTRWATDDLCSEYDGTEYIDTRKHEW